MVYKGWLATQKLRLAVAKDYVRPLGKLAKGYSWAFGWPVLVKAFDYSMKGLGKAIDGVEWTAHTALEGTKGALQMTAAPVAMLAYSRLRTVKRFLWDVPIATASAVIRTPIAIAKSPLEMVRGVRDAIVSVPRNAMEILNSVRQFKLMDTISNTRKAITDVLLPPITRPLKPVLTPAYNFANTALGAELQTVSTARRAITDTIPGGARRIWNAPATASAEMAEVHARRAAIKAAYAKEQEEKEAALKAAVAEEKGEAGGAKGGGGGGMKMG